MMHRLGAPEVSPDGQWAVFTISDTDLAKNKRNNTLYLLDLDRPGAAPQPVKGAEKGHDAVFAADGSMWFLMAAGDHDQLFRMPGGAPVQVSNFKGDVAGFKLCPSGNRVVMFADRDLRCADLPATAARQARPDRPDLRPAVHPPLGYLGRAGHALAPVRLPGPGGKVSGEACALTSGLVGDTPSKPFGGGEEIALLARRQDRLFRAARSGPDRAVSTNLDIFAAPSDGSAAPVNLTDANDAHRQAADGLARRPDARLCRDGPAGLRSRPPGADAARPCQRPDARR